MVLYELFVSVLDIVYGTVVVHRETSRNVDLICALVKVSGGCASSSRAFISFDRRGCLILRSCGIDNLIT